MYGTKYVVISDGIEGSDELMFTAPAVVEHRWLFEMAIMVKKGSPARFARPYRDAQCVAAGFITEDGECHGNSETLGVRARPQIDAALLARQLR